MRLTISPIFYCRYVVYKFLKRKSMYTLKLEIELNVVLNFTRDILNKKSLALLDNIITKTICQRFTPKPSSNKIKLLFYFFGGLFS